MHEIGILYSAAETSSQYAQKNGLEEVHVISLELGELAGVLPNVFTEYFDYVKAQFPLLKGAELELKNVPGKALCNECGTLYNVMKNKGKCPSCSSTAKKILSGKNIRLMSIA